MGCDMLVALGRATVDGATLIGHNSDQPIGQFQALCRTAGQDHAADEKNRTHSWELPQARQTFTVLGTQPHGAWGYTQGVNEHGLAVGCTRLRNKIPCREGGFLGPDLVRLALERCRSVAQAVDLLTTVVERYGQRVWADTSPEDAGDNLFLVADPTRATVVETAGNHWVCQDVYEVRAVSNLSTVHQDWDRISRGLSEQVLRQGWWPADGTKLDFADAVGHNPVGQESALRRWGRATLLLEQANGGIDVTLMRRILCDHYEGTLCEVDPLARLQGPAPLCSHGSTASGRATAASFVTTLTGPGDRLPVIWYAFGPPCLTAYLPLFLVGNLPESLSHPCGSGRGLGERVKRLAVHLFETPEDWACLRDDFAKLQVRYNQESAEFAAEGAALKAHGAHSELERLAGLYMQHAIEQFEAVLAERRGRDSRRTFSGARSTDLALRRF